ncbi:hypothetical protein FAUST_9972 [Fusarium austroamericanum]|uniref:Uncharacterized protein n=1 Tax=Fusarium austroamericanum TaxID=282268 RepID=A0AAN6BVU2_FUSAU|nr:hypothetical protein FAUST_9972 [Fusarium austroamericanum]
MATNDLIPDHSILSGIPMIKDSVSGLENTFREKCNVISNNFTTCTFDIHLDTLPLVLDVGTTSTAEGKRLEYSVTEFVSDAITLDQEWDKLDGLAQKDLTCSIIDAISKLQSLILDSELVQKILQGTPYYRDG